MEQLEMLWHLQAIDLAFRELEKKCEHNPQETEVEEARQGLACLTASREQTIGKLKELRRKQKLLELDLHQVSTNRNALRNKLYGGGVGNVRELETLEKKLRIVEREQGVLEERIIELMETTEELEAHLKEEERQVRSQAQVLAEQERILEEVMSGLKAELDRLREKREAAADRIDRQYLELYALQSGRHHGQGIARVINDNCEGCRVFISSAQRGSLYNPRAMVYCENCGRLLVRLQTPEQPEAPAGTGKEVKGGEKKNPLKKGGQAAG